MKYRTHGMRFSYSVRGMATVERERPGSRARGSKRAWIEMADITRRSRRRGRMIDARQLRRPCVTRVATLSLYNTRVACGDYYSNFHDSQCPAGFQQAVADCPPRLLLVNIY